MPKNWLQKRKNNIGNLAIVGSKKRRKHWFGPTNRFYHNVSLLTTVHALNHWSNDKMIVFIKQYWWGNINKATESAHLAIPICSRHDSGKLSCTAPGLFKLLNGTFKFWQMDFIQLLLPHGYSYVLVTACMFSHWTKVIPCKQATTVFPQK